MRKCKVHIIFEFQENGSGGGNQFLLALKRNLSKLGCYTNNSEDADIILFNSYQYVEKILDIRKKHGDKIFVHRVDGPIKLYNHPSDRRDDITYVLNSEIADATVYQSNWSKYKCKESGIKDHAYEVTILNAPDSDIFNPNKKNYSEGNTSFKNRIIITSWSSNLNKGFNDYLWVDRNLDFNKYDVIFVGNSPYKFENIKSLSARNSESLADELLKSDMYLTASINDPCSNSLIEAIHSNLVPLALDSGGHTEIVNRSGVGATFKDIKELPLKLEVLERKERRCEQSLPNLNQVTKEYLDFFELLINNKEDIKKIANYNALSYFKVNYILLKEKVFRRLNRNG